jgi:hypothetical protein
MTMGKDSMEWDFKMDMDIWATDRANELLVKLIFGLTDSEMDEISEESYKVLVDEVSKKKETIQLKK